MGMDICKLNNATFELAIATFFHCDNIPDAVVESPRFLRLVCVCCLAGEDYVAPNQKKIGGDLLDLNYTNAYQQNKEEILMLAFMGDGATSH